MAEAQKLEQTFSSPKSIQCGDGRMVLGMLPKVVLGIAQEGLEVHAGAPDLATDIEITIEFQLFIRQAY
jgi:hypothetical protein